jgi:hypothetical protein
MLSSGAAGKGCPRTAQLNRILIVFWVGSQVCQTGQTWGTLYNRVGIVKRHVDPRRVLTFLFVEGFGFGVALGVAFALCSCDQGPLSESCGGSLVPPTIYPVTDFRP